MAVTLHGRIHGTTIRLDGESGLPDGQEVTVTVQSAAPSANAAVLQALRDAAGTWADDVVGLDCFLEWNRQQRKANRRELAE